MATKAETFRANLQEAAALRGLDLGGLATKAGFRFDERKWLERLWTKGLHRPDARTQRNLNRLCAVLGIKQSHELWDEKFQPSPISVMSDREEWAELVGNILWKFQLFQQSKIRQGSMVRAALKRYGHNESLFIADWVAHERGIKRLGDADLDWLKEVIGEVREELEYNHEQYGSIVEYVRDRASSHPKWSQFEDEIKSHGNGDVEETLVEIIQTLQYRTLTPPEVCEQFIRIFLDGKDAPTNIEFSLTQKVMERLSRHSEWSLYIEERCDGSEELANASVSRMWREAVETMGATVTIDTFVRFFERCHLDAPEKSQRMNEAAATENRLSVKLDGSPI